MLELAGSVDAETSDEFELAGTGRCFRGYTSPVFDPQGNLAGRVWTLREVTADRELDRMRDAFVATVSHELRTPLTSISGFLEMMEDEEHGVGETGRTYLEVIRRSTDRLHDLVEDLLLIAQIEARRVELALDRVDLAALVARSIESYLPKAVEKQVSLELAPVLVPVRMIEPVLPPGDLLAGGDSDLFASFGLTHDLKCGRLYRRDTVRRSRDRCRLARNVPRSSSQSGSSADRRVR